MRLKNLIVAAGGILYRMEGDELLCALVRSAKRRTWELPKGKVDDTDQSLLATAVREVEEETGCRVQPLGYAGSYRYRIAEGLKMVAVWHMQVTKQYAFPLHDDILEMQWFRLDEAVLKLHRPEESKFLCDVFKLHDEQPKGLDRHRLSRSSDSESFLAYSEFHLSDVLYN